MSKKVALVSGGSRGLGREIAIYLAQQDYQIVITYVSNPDKAQQVVEHIEQNQGKAVAFKADVANNQEIQQLFKTIKEKFGRIDVVINTAAISILKPLASFELSEVEKIVNTNFIGTFNLLNLSAQYVEHGGRILTFSSNVTDSLPVNYSLYAATKSAVESMSKVFSKELRGREITVNIISPGPTGTEMFLEGKSPELVDHFAKLSPFERLGTPQDITQVIGFLISDQATWINGQVIKINGGAN